MIDFMMVFRTSFWFLPIPFMILYYIKTKKLEWMYNPLTASVPFLIMFLIVFDVHLGDFNPVLMSYYIIAGYVGVLLFKRKHNFLQAVSLVFNMIFFSMLYWESPIYIFTIINRGYISQAISLHILPIFSFYFLYNVMDIDIRSNLPLLFTGFALSSIAIYFLLYSNVNIWYMEEYLKGMYWFKEIVYSIARTICITILYYMFYNCEPRRKKR